MKCHIVDVFAEAGLAGNQLAVVRDCAHLDTQAMQAIAREMNFSETTFVLDERPERARVRIFTPDLELPFAGHPTLGTAWVLGADRPEYTLELDAGPVRVTFAEDGVVWMNPPAVEFGDLVGADMAARLLNLDAADVDSGFPCRRAVVGPHFLLVGLRDLEALGRASANALELRAFSGPDFLCLFAFTPFGHGTAAEFSARMFFDSNGIREDAATGSANAAFGAYLGALGRSGRFTVEQGFEMGRPSNVYLDVGAAIRVGGRVQRVLDGEFRFEV